MGSMRRSIYLLLGGCWLAAAGVVAGPVRHPVYEPEPAGPARVLTAEEQAQPVRLVPVSPRVRYGRDEVPILPPSSEGTPLMLRAWRGERVTAQVLAISPKGFEELTVEPLELTYADGSKLPVRLDWVRYTLADGKLVADVLDGTAQTRFAGVTRPLFLSIDVPRDREGMVYGVLTVRINGQVCRLPLLLVAGGPVLPPPEQWQCHVDIWQHPDAVARWHDVPMWSPEHFALLKPQMVRLAQLGQKTITATLIDEAWDGQTYDRFRSMVEVTRRADGTWAYDYSAFDNWVEFMRREVGLLQATIHCYTMIPWSLRFAYYDEAQGRRVAPKLQPGSPEYADFWEHFLAAFVEHVRTKGWLEQVRLAMDERPDHLLRPALEIVRKAAPELKLVAACDRPSELNSAFADVSYSYGIAEKLFGIAAERRAKGQFTTFYVCCHPARPNTFMASDLAESEWLLPFAAHCGLDGFLRWAYHSWVENPLASQDYTSWPSGDTALIYPGNRSSLRLEALRNGIETFEKIRLLRESAEPEVLEKVEAALERFTVPRGGQDGHLADLEALDKALP